MTGDREALREQYLAAIEHEIAAGRNRLSVAREGLRSDASRRAQAAAAVVDVTLDWLEAERERVRAGGSFNEEEARRLLSQD